APAWRATSSTATSAFLPPADNSRRDRYASTSINTPAAWRPKSPRAGWYAFRAHRAPAVPASASAAGVPDISGLWEIPTKSSKGEAAWHFIVRQNGGEISAAILRGGGDAGALPGAWRDGKFVLSHFSGPRPNLLEITPADNGTLRPMLFMTVFVP